MENWSLEEKARLIAEMDEIIRTRKELNSEARMVRKNWDSLRKKLLEEKIQARRLGFCYICDKIVRKKLLRNMYLNGVTIATNFLLGEFRWGDRTIISICTICMGDKVRPIHPFYPKPEGYKHIPFGDNIHDWRLYPIKEIEEHEIICIAYNEYGWGESPNEFTIARSEIIDNRLPLGKLIERPNIQARFGIPPKMLAE